MRNIKTYLKCIFLRDSLALRWRRVSSKGYHIRHHQYIYGLLALFIIALMQSTLLNYFRIFNVKPDAILAALVIFVAFFNLRWSVSFAFLGGVFRDIFSILPFGLNTSLCILWIILAKQISRRLSMENELTRSAILCLIIILNSLALQSILFIVDRPIVMGVFFRIASIESILTLLLALPMYRLFARLFMD